MRVPLNWLKDYVKLPATNLLTNKLTMAGHMLDKQSLSLNDKTHVVIDLELRGNRADCYSIFGIAREVSALFNTPAKYPFTTKNFKTIKELKNINLKVDPQFVKRVVMTTIQEIKIMKSPKWLKTKLEEYGIESINNIVDLTNFVTIETGQPMHAFDLELLNEDSEVINLNIRLAKEDEEITTFQDKKMKLTKDDLVWANDNSVLSIAGAIGGKYHSISPNTKNILIEAANYDRANIRRTIHKHNLFTDAGIRHEKDLDANLVDVAVKRFIDLVEKNKWGKVNSNLYDYYPKKSLPWKVVLNFDFLKSLSGFEIDKRIVKEILKRLNFEIVKENDKSLWVQIPTYRTDVTLEEDLIEEVIRIYGYDQIPEQVLSLEVPEVVTPNYIKQELKLKNDLVSLGFDEIISLSFVKENLLELNKPINEYKVAVNIIEPVRIINRPSPDIEFLRISLLPNLFEAAQKVKNERGERLEFFEIGKVYGKLKNEYIEKRKLGIICWSKKQNDYYNFKGIIDSIFEKIGLKEPGFENDDKLDGLNYAYNIFSGKEIIGQGGTYKDNYYVEIDLDSILNKIKLPDVKLWPKYPPQIEDLTFVVPEKIKIGEMINQIKKIENISDIQLTDIFKDNYTFRIWYQNPEKTLNDKEVKKLRDKILKEINQKFGAIIKE